MIGQGLARPPRGGFEELTFVPMGPSIARPNTGALSSSLPSRITEVAQAAFQRGDYREAQTECEGAIRQVPRDPNLHEFRGLCQFAQGKYKDAAATLYEALTAGGGWDRDTLSSFYARAQTYSDQLRALERYVGENPKEATERILLAYHYFVLDKREAAVGQLQAVIKLVPKDQVSPAILDALEEATSGNAARGR